MILASHMNVNCSQRMILQRLLILAFMLWTIFACILRQRVPCAPSGTGILARHKIDPTLGRAWLCRSHHTVAFLTDVSDGVSTAQPAKLAKPLPCISSEAALWTPGGPRRPQPPSKAAAAWRLQNGLPLHGGSHGAHELRGPMMIVACDGAP